MLLVGISGKESSWRKIYKISCPIKELEILELNKNLYRAFSEWKAYLSDSEDL